MQLPNALLNKQRHQGPQHALVLRSYLHQRAQRLMPHLHGTPNRVSKASLEFMRRLVDRDLQALQVPTMRGFYTMWASLHWPEDA